MMVTGKTNRKIVDLRIQTDQMRDQLISIEYGNECNRQTDILVIAQINTQTFTWNKNRQR
jgi:hypothetical protein